MTSPEFDTFATFVLLLDHVTVPPEDGDVVAVSFLESPANSEIEDVSSVIFGSAIVIEVVAVAICLPLFVNVAVITAEPDPFAVTRPLDDTVATLVLLLDQFTVPFDGLLFDADSCKVFPRSRLPPPLIESDPAFTETDVVAEYDLPSYVMVAVIVAVPLPCAVKLPPEIVATLVLLLDHVTDCPAGVVFTVIVAVSPGYRFDVPDALTDIAGTMLVCTDTLHEALYLLELYVNCAVIVAFPAATAVTRPLELTDATPELLLDQLMLVPLGAPLAESDIVLPTTIVA